MKSKVPRHSPKYMESSQSNRRFKDLLLWNHLHMDMHGLGIIHKLKRINKIADFLPKAH